MDKIKQFIKNSWEGDVAAWKIFFFHYLLFRIVLLALLFAGFIFIQIQFAPSDQNIIIGIFAFILVASFLWSYALLWKNAFNTKNKIIGHLLRTVVTIEMLAVFWLIEFTNMQ